MAESTPNRFYVYKGNFSYVIKNLLKERGNWKENEDENHSFKQAQFIWKPENLFEYV